VPDSVTPFHVSKLRDFCTLVTMEKADKIILGIDPGTTIMGYGIIRVKGKSEIEMIEMGALHLSKYPDHALKLKKIYDRCLQLIETHEPDVMAVEAPFFGKNVQSMLKLGRAQGVAFAAALSKDLTIAEYAPRKIKKAITGSGAASKEQVAGMVQRTLKLRDEDMPKQLDATDGIAVALCHHYQLSSPTMQSGGSGWKAFIKDNPSRVKS
jgi:crossover junction endodeoxyribonuclease RuvC